PPRIDSLQARTEGGVVHVTFRAVDSFSPVSRAEYSIDAGDWQFVEPVGQLSDQLTENYDFNIPLPATTAQPLATEPEQPGKAKGRKNTAQANPTGEHTIVVRVYDRFDNQVSAKTVTNASSK